MSVFKKLVGFLFEEEEDLEDDELEDFSFLEEKEEEPLPKEIVNIRRPKAREVKETPQHHSAVSEASFGQPAAKETKFTSIEVSEQEAPKRTQAPKERIVGSKRNVKRSEPIRKEFEFTPVISPIFGVDEETENTRSGSPKVDIPPLRATIATAPKKIRLVRFFHRCTVQMNWKNSKKKRRPAWKMKARPNMRWTDLTMWMRWRLLTMMRKSMRRKSYGYLWKNC